MAADPDGHRDYMELLTDQQKLGLFSNEDPEEEPASDAGSSVPSVVEPRPPAVPESSRHQESMDPTALVFLEDSLARRLAVAWRTCGGDEKYWLEAAGIQGGLLHDAHRICNALRINGICRDGGITDPLALNYIRTIVAKPLTRGLRKEEKKPDEQRRPADQD